VSPPSVRFRCRAFEDLWVREMHDLYQLRNEVFIVEQNCPYQDIDGLDPHALHLLGLGEGTSGDPMLICYARLLPMGTSYPEHAAIGRVITKQTVRGTGLGHVLMREAMRIVDAEWDTPPLRLGAQDYAIPFYEALGFQSIGEHYLEDGIPHTTMERVRTG